MVPVDVKGEKISAHDCAEVDQKEMALPQFELHGRTEEIQAEHIEEQMSPIGV